MTLVVFGLLIFIHELGHFLMAKWTGVRVLEFCLGFGPRVAGFKRDGTAYNLRLIPLGGFVQMEGEDPAGSGGAGAENRSESAVPPALDSGNFQNKKPWQQMLVIVGGVFMNFLLGTVLLMVVWGAYGAAVMAPAAENQIGKLVSGKPAEQAGLKVGDHIVAINGTAISSGEQMMAAIHGLPNQDLHIAVTRSGQRLEFTVHSYQSPDTKFGLIGFAPQQTLQVEFSRGSNQVAAVEPGSPAAKAGLEPGDVITAIGGKPAGDPGQMEFEPIAIGGRIPVILRQVPPTYRLAFQVRRGGALAATPEVEASVLTSAFDTPAGKASPASVAALGLTLRPMTAGEVLGDSLRQMWEFTVMPVRAVQLLLQKKVSGKEMAEGTSGPLGIGTMIFSFSKKGLPYILFVAAMLNVMIGFFNILPIPALDGARFWFVVVGALRGKPVNQELEGKIHWVGMMLLLALVVLFTYNDIVRLIKGTPLVH